MKTKLVFGAMAVRMRSSETATEAVFSERLQGSRDIRPLKIRLNLWSHRSKYYKPYWKPHPVPREQRSIYRSKYWKRNTEEGFDLNTKRLKDQEQLLQFLLPNHLSHKQAHCNKQHDYNQDTRSLDTHPNAIHSFHSVQQNYFFPSRSGNTATMSVQCITV